MGFKSATIRLMLRSTRGMFESERISLRTKRFLVDALAAASPPPPEAVVHTRHIAGVVVDEVSCGRATEETRSAVLFLHGGGYALGSARGYRGLGARISQATGLPVLLPDYLRAPERPFPAALDQVEELYRRLLDLGYESSQLIIAGDSAGGGMTLALAMRLRDRDVELPAALGLISPWLDLAADVAGTRAPGRDPLITTRLTSVWAQRYVNAHDARDPQISPVHGDLNGLPPIVMHSAELDPISADAHLLESRLHETKADTPLDHRLYRDRWHDFHLQAAYLKDAAAAVREMGVKLRGHIADPQLRERPAQPVADHLDAPRK